MLKTLKMLIFAVVNLVAQLLLSYLAIKHVIAYGTYLWIAVLYTIIVVFSFIFAKKISNFIIVDLKKGTAVMDKVSKKIFFISNKFTQLFSWDKTIQNRELFGPVRIEKTMVVNLTSGKNINSQETKKLEYCCSVISKTDEKSVVRSYKLFKKKDNEARELFFERILEKFNEDRYLSFMVFSQPLYVDQQKIFFNFFTECLNPILERFGLEVETAKFTRPEPSYFN